MSEDEEKSLSEQISELSEKVDKRRTSQAMPSWLAAATGIVAIVYFFADYADVPRRVTVLELSRVTTEQEIQSLRSDVNKGTVNEAGDSATLHQVDDRTKRIENTLDALHGK